MAAPGEATMFTITVLYDNESVRPELEHDWGFAALVSIADGGSILFDTGADGHLLLRNASALGLDLSTVSAIVISHWHWDHAGGLPIVLREAAGAHLYVPPPGSEHVPPDRLHVVGPDPIEIVPGVYSTGVVDGIEQAVVLVNGRRGSVLMGCAHPGVAALLAAAARVAEPYALIGGLHGFADLSVLEGLDAVYPCHCTQRKQEILKAYPQRAVRCGAGIIVEA
jgi:7,8-dihydropterin-6-yl-methyl-4-(beta-D-ribofuranosyl)aminobenzene 5'-phosphate synthase